MTNPIAAALGARPGESLLDAARRVVAERDGARGALADMVDQYMSCIEGYITHEFMSAQETTIDYLQRAGWLRDIGYERFVWTPQSGRISRYQAKKARNS